MTDNTELLAHAPQATVTIDDKALEALVVGGDMSKLTSAQRLQVYKARCDAAGLDMRVQPFEFITLQGKLTLYARKAATDQLAAIHRAKCRILSRETADDIHSVIVEVALGDGRSTEEIGCVNVKGLSGDNLANARMKAMTKAKRRAILSLCGLGMVDETEIESIPTARAWSEPTRTLEAVVAATPPTSPQEVSEAQTPQNTYKGITIALTRPWEEFCGEKIGGANPVLAEQTWEWLLTTDDAAGLEQAGKALKGGAAQQEKTQKPVPERYQMLALTMQMREQMTPKDLAP